MSDIKSFHQIVLIGSGKLLSECSNIVQKNFNKKIIIIENESSLTSMSKFKEYKNITLLKLFDRKNVINFFNDIKINSLIVSANNNFIFLKEHVEKKNFLIINFHNALLSRYRGRNCQMWTIFYGEEYAGATWHIVNSNIDDGDIIIEQEIKVDKMITSLKLTEILINEGINLFEIIIQDIINLKIKVQKHKYKNFIVKNKNDLPDDGILDLTKDYNHINNFLRAMDFGRLRIVPLPKIHIFGEIQEIRKYSISKKTLQLHFLNEIIIIELKEKK